MTESVKASTLVLDMALYPRHDLDSVNLTRLSHALDAGNVLPPVIADRATRRVVDGFHRVTVVLRRDNEGAIDVEWRDYADDGELFLDAVRINDAHGARLTPYDRSKTLAVAERLSIDESLIAGALHVTVDVAGKLRAAKTAFDSSGKPMEIKRTIRHLAGSHLSDTQIEAHRRSGGMSVAFYANQVTNAIRGDLVDLNDAATHKALDELRVALAEIPAIEAIS